MSCANGTHLERTRCTKFSFVKPFWAKNIPFSRCSIQNICFVFLISKLNDICSMAAVYAVMALKKKGYDVWLAGGRESINDTFLSEVAQFGVNIAVIYDTPYLLERDLYWIESFDIVIVNVFQMLKCACDISCKRPVLWWLHEPDLSYGPILSRFPEYHDSMNLKNMHIVGVSDIAKDSFGHYFQNVNCGTMAYGIPDERIPSIKSIKKEKFIYAIIGHISYHKGQDIFLRAVELMGMIALKT